jgi:deazaflavin-dependent oxidoreductase (nitroreductase family)
MDVLSRELRDGPLVEISTTGRRTRQPHRIEIWMLDIDGRFFITGTPGRRDWLANVTADPHLLVHLVRHAQIDLHAHATPVTDPATRRRVLQHAAAEWYRTQAPLDVLVDRSPMIEVRIEPSSTPPENRQ